MLGALLNWRLRTPFYYGWLVLGMTSLATFAATGVSQVVLGGIQIYITDDTGWNDNLLSFAATIGTWCSGLLAPAIGRAADRWGPRWLMPAGLAILGVCFFILLGGQSVWQFYLGYIIGRAVSNPILIGLVPRTAAVNFFRRRRNLALAMVSTFRPIAGAINIQLISLIALRQGWRAAYGYMGVMTLALIVPVALFMRRQPEDLGLQPDGAAASTSGGRAASAAAPESSWTVREAIRTPTFWMITVTGSLGTLASSSVGFSLVPYLVDDVGLSGGVAAGVLSLGTALSIANVGWGLLSDRFTPRRCLVVTMLGSAGMLLYLISVGSLWSALGFAVVWGVFSGAVGTMENMVLAHYYGRGSYGTLLGIYSPFQTAALGLGPSLASLLRAATGGFAAMYLAMTAVYVASAALMFLARRPRRRGEAAAPPA